MSTLIEELEQAAEFYEAAGEEFSDAGKVVLAETVARLRARAERARAFPRLLSGEVQVPGVTTTAEMFEWLTGPLETPPTPPSRPRGDR